ncbi:ABC transporter substrate-binding protein [Streptomyces sp. SCSIO 75703]|uniref:ABC transporter substrate-binding protein n=1 Tax=unclassified Streptomyces TaxID=2593676 RepID=UPI0004BFE07A|nr:MULTISPECIES: ABC transporter substrate-binding protein [unclassified Streptomyces]
MTRDRSGPTAAMAENTRRARPGVARFDTLGQCERLDVRGCDLVLHERVRRWATLMPETGRTAVCFVWITEDGGWARVDLAAPPTAEGRPITVTAAVRRCDPPYGLTLRELDVLTLLAGGLTNGSVAHYLGTSPRTVGKQVESLLDKLGQPSRAAAAAFAVDSGLLRLPVPGGCAELSALGAGMLDALDRGRPAPPRFAGAPRPGTRHFVPRPLTVGLMAPLLGAYGADGEELRRGAELAVAEVNARGGVAGRPLELASFALDNQDAASVDAAFRAVADHDLAALVGSYLLVDERPSYERAAAYGLPYLNVGSSDLQAAWVASEPTVFGNVFQAGPRRSNYVRGFLRFAAHTSAAGLWRPGRRTVGVVEPGVADGEILGERGADLVEAAGWRVQFRIRSGPPYDDWTRVLEQVRRTAPDALLLGNHPPVAMAAFQRAFARDPSPTLVYNVYTPSVPAYLAEAGEAAEGVVWASVTGRYGDARGAGFARDYARLHGRAPGHGLAGAGYDQVQVLARAWSGLDAPGRPAETVAALRHVVHRGVNGAYFLGAAGQTNAAYPDESPDPSLSQAPLVYQVQGGRSRAVHPAPYAEASFRPPPWLARAAR